MIVLSPTKYTPAIPSQPPKAIEAYGYVMKPDTEAMRMQAQQTLDELYLERLLPFKLVAHKVESLGMEEYIVRFHDSRLHSLDLSLRRDQVFRTIFRAAILSRVARLETRFQVARRA